MSKYLKISSVSTTNPVDMFTLGVSTARGVEGKIGQFGSGSLMSTLLWLRRFGESPVFLLNGTRVEFHCIPEQTTTGGVFKRVFQVVDGVDAPLSVALEYGEIDWQGHEMALREWICNALDQGATIYECLSIVDSVTADDSEVAVFVPLCPEVSLYWQNLDQYFLHMTGKQDQVTIEKPAPSPCRLYRRGVFVRELSGVLSLFDYNVNDLEVNECRTGSSDSMERRLKNIVDGFRDGGRAYYDRLFEVVCHGTECWELHQGSSWLYFGWHNTLKAATCKIVRENAPQGLTGYRVKGSWFTGFTGINPALSGYADNYAAEQGIIPSPAGKDLQLLADRCFSFLSALLPGHTRGKVQPSVFSFKTVDGDMPSRLGRYDSDTHRVFIWQDQASSVQTMLEEMAHAISGKHDCTRDFQEYLFRCLAESMELIE